MTPLSNHPLLNVTIYGNILAFMRLLFFTFFAFFLTNSARAETLQKGEIGLKGIVFSVAKDAKSFQLEVDAFTLPNGKTGRLDTPKTKMIYMIANAAIYPHGAPQWRIKPSSLRPGYEAFAVGKDGSGAGFVARSVGLKREIEGRKIDYFVAKNGSDSGDGRFEAPFLTVQAAVDRVPSGFTDEPCVIHIGPGIFAESFDGRSAQLRVEGKKNLILTGAGAKTEGGTQISTGDMAKLRNVDVLRLINCQNVQICNMIVGDDKSWAEDRAYEATLKVSGVSTVSLRAVRIAGPTRETMLDADGKTAPNALGCDNLNGVVDVENVLVTGHGSFLSNPEGKVFSRRLTAAYLFGTGYDDHFLFLQTPHNAPRDDPRFTFSDCIFYEIEGGRGGSRFYLSTGDAGLDKAYFNAPKSPEGGNWVVRCRYEKPDVVFETKNLRAAFLDTRGIEPRTHGVFEGDKNDNPLAGGVKVDNELQLKKRDGFLLTAPKNKASGWTGGFWCPADAAISKSP